MARLLRKNKQVNRRLGLIGLVLKPETPSTTLDTVKAAVTAELNNME